MPIIVIIDAFIQLFLSAFIFIATLNFIYDNFVRKYGLINTRVNNQAFSEDSSYYLLCSLEEIDSKGKFIKKTDMFTKKTIKAKKEITKGEIKNPKIAIIILKIKTGIKAAKISLQKFIINILTATVTTAIIKNKIKYPFTFDFLNLPLQL